MKKILLILAVLTLPLAVFSQNSRVLYFMDLPQNRNLNPAFKPSDSVNIALPASGFAFSFNNNFINFSDIIKTGKSDSLITFLHPDFGTDKFLDGIRRKNSFDLDFMMQIFSLGFNVGRDGYVFFDFNEKFQGRTAIPGDLFKLALKGNEAFAGDYIDFSASKFKFQYYHEAGLGYSRNINSRLRAGIKAKLLLGLVSANFDNNSLGIRIGENYSHLFDADASMNLSGPFTITRDSDGNIEDIESDDKQFRNTMLLKGPKNIGTALDAGVTYILNPKIVLSAAVTDFGLIRWKNGVSNLKTKNQFEFNGIDMTDVINGDKTFEEAGEDLLDSIKDTFSPDVLHVPYTTFTPASLNLAGSYQFTRNLRFGLLSTSRFMGRQVKESLTASANVNLGSSLLASVSYTASNHRFDNFGAGLALRLSIFQFYIMSDRIPVFWNKIYTDSNENNRTDGNFVVLPANWNTLDLRFGMNLVFGHRKKKAVIDACGYEEEPGVDPEKLKQ